MTIKELKEQIKDLSDDIEIVMSKDSEGNNFSPLVEWTNEYYIPDSTYSGEIAYSEQDFKDDIDLSFEYDSYLDYLKDNEAVKAIVLWPTN